MKGKKGFLLVSETLKIIIAVICIGFLIYFLVHLYSSNKESKGLEFAKESLRNLISEINAQSLEVSIYNPKDWIIVSWPNEFTTGALLWKKTEEGVPKSCSNLGWDNCICICPKNKPDKCDEKGTCMESEFIIDDSIEIKNPPITLRIDYDNNKIR